MGLINDQLQKNSQTTTPKIRAIKTASPLPELQPADTSPVINPTEAAPPQAAISADAPQLDQQDNFPVVDPDPQVQQPPQPSEITDLNFLPVAPVDLPKQPEQAIVPTAPIWQDVNKIPDSRGQFSVNVANTHLPSFSVQTPESQSNSALQGLNQTIGQFNKSQEGQDYSAAQALDTWNNSRFNLPNTPQADKKWYSAPIGYLGDILFGSEKARKESEAGNYDPGAGSFGRLGAGVGGAINYGLQVFPGLFVGAVAEVDKNVARGLTALGVDKKASENFTRNGFLGFLPDRIPLPGTHTDYEHGSLKQVPNSLDISGIKPSNILHFDFDDAKTKNYLGEALIGNPLTDIRQPVGATKYGRVFTRPQRKDGQTSGEDPVGLALQALTFVFNPGEIPGEKLSSLAIGKLFSAFAKPIIAPTVEKTGQIVLVRTAAQKAEQELAERAAKIRANVDFNRRVAGSAAKPSLFNLDNIGEDQLHRLMNGTPQISGKAPDNFPLLNGQQRATKFIEGDNRITTTGAEELNPPRINLGDANFEYPAIEGTSALSSRADTELFPPRINLGDARIENPELAGGTNTITTTNGTDLNPPRFDYGEATIEYTDNTNYLAGARPTEAPRVYSGTNTVSQQKLPPVFSPEEVPDAFYTPLLPASNPGRTAAEIGLGNRGVRIESPGALAIRPLSQVLEKLSEVAPDLVQDFKGITWEEFKAHLSNKVPDISAYNAVGSELAPVNIPVPKASTPAQQLTEKFLQARVTRGQEQIDNGFNYAVAVKNSVASPTDRDALNQFLIRDIYDTPEATASISNKLRELDFPDDKIPEITKVLQRSFKGDEVAKDEISLNFREEFKGKRDAWNKFKTGDFWKEPSIQKVVEQKFSTILKPTKNLIVKAGDRPRYFKLDVSSLTPPPNLGNLDPKLVEETANSINKGISRPIAVRQTGAETFEPLPGYELEYAAALKAKEIDPRANEMVSSFVVPEGKLESNASNVTPKANINGEHQFYTVDVSSIESSGVKGNFSEQSINDLAADINKHGLVEPIRLEQTGIESYKVIPEDELKYTAAVKAKELDPRANEMVNSYVFKKKLTPVHTEDDLLTAANELALHKQTIAKPLNALDDLFEDTVDFGRRAIDEPNIKPYHPEEVETAALNNGTTKLRGTSPETEAFNTARANNIPDLKGTVARVTEEHNALIKLNSTVAPNKIPQSYLSKPPKVLYHGTALDDWRLPQDLYANGSRGEIGHGTYFTKDQQVAGDYARARVGENANPATLDYDVQPTVYTANHTFEKTLNARKALPQKYIDQILADVPADIKANISLKKNPTFVDTKVSVENAIAKSGVHPSEELLQQIDADISKNLRTLGFDSVHDSKSGFVLSLDNSKVALENKYGTKLPHPTPIESAQARYNADSFTAGVYKDHLTTDANLRDSAYKFHAQAEQATDKALGDVQQKIIDNLKREPESILPKVADDSKAPSSFVEATDELTTPDICGL